jgi:polar amino acid transport system substrate-binding protein
MLKRIIVAGVAALVAAGLMAPVSVDARTLDEIIKAGSIKIGVHPNGGVRSQINPKGEWEGFDIDISERLGEMLGVKVEYVPTETPQRIPNLVSDRTDIQLGALTRTPDRMKVIDYSVPLHTESMAVLYTSKLDAKIPNLKSWRDLNREDITAADCRGCWPVKWVQKNLPKVKMMLVDSGADSTRVVAQGRADVIIENLDFYGTYTAQYPDVTWKVLPDVIATEYCGIGVKKGNDSVRHWLNAAMFSMQKADFHNEAWEKHFGSRQVVPVVPQPYF